MENGFEKRVGLFEKNVEMYIKKETDFVEYQEKHGLWDWNKLVTTWYAESKNNTILSTKDSYMVLKKKILSHQPFTELILSFAPTISVSMLMDIIDISIPIIINRGTNKQGIVKGLDIVVKLLHTGKWYLDSTCISIWMLVSSRKIIYHVTHIALGLKCRQKDCQLCRCNLGIKGSTYVSTGAKNASLYQWAQDLIQLNECPVHKVFAVMYYLADTDRIYDAFFFLLNQFINIG